jgi:hypothetical protein
VTGSILELPLDHWRISSDFFWTRVANHCEAATSPPEELQTEGFGEARKPSTRKRPQETTKDFTIPRTINNNLHLSQNQEMSGSQAFTR